MRWWPFGRAAAGRHALGAAVTSIPSGPPVPAVPVPAVPVPTAAPEPDAPSLEDLLAAYAHLLTPEPAGPAPAVPEPTMPAPAVPAPSGGVQLGFRDGTTAELDPQQSAALHDLARALTGSD